MNKQNAVKHLKNIIFSSSFPHIYHQKARGEQKEILKTLAQAKGMLTEVQ